MSILDSDKGPSGTATLTQMVTSVAISTVLNTSHSIVLATAGAGGITITLPTAVGISGRQYIVVKVDAAAGGVTIEADGTATIDGSLTYLLANQWQYAAFYSDGANWIIGANN